MLNFVNFRMHYNLFSKLATERECLMVLDVLVTLVLPNQSTMYNYSSFLKHMRKGIAMIQW